MHTYSYVHGQRALTTNSSRIFSLLRLEVQTLMLGAVLLAAPLQAQVGLGLSPMKVEFPAVAGKAYSGTLTVSNSSARKVRVRTELLDFFVDQNQTPQFLPEIPSEEGYSCRQWITVNPMESEVEPRSVLSARYTVRVPPGVQPGSHYCAIGFVSLPTDDDVQGFGVKTAIRVVATLYSMVGETAPEGSIAELGLEPVVTGGKTRWRGVVVMDNPGLTLYRPLGRLEIVDASGAVVEAAEMSPFPVLPERKQRFLLPLKNQLAPGRYTLRARVDLGSEVQEAAAEVSVASRKPAESSGQ